MTELTALNVDARELEEAYWQAVATEIPAKKCCPTDLFWNELRQVLVGFLDMTERRKRWSPRSGRDYWRRIVSLTDELAGEMRTIRRQDPSWGTGSEQFLSALWEIRDRAEARAVANEQLADPKFLRGRLERTFLYGAVLDLWHYDLGLPISCSNRTKDGPLVRFFRTVVNPALSLVGMKALTNHAVTKIIRAEKHRRQVRAVLDAKTRKRGHSKSKNKI
jgi:hypothetical protein